MNCPACGASVRETDKFCSECGTTLEAKRNDAPCRACGQMVPMGAKFCGNCGASEPHSVPAGATGETVVSRAPLRPGSEPKPEAKAEAEVEAKADVEPKTEVAAEAKPEPVVAERERERTEPPPTAVLPPEGDDADTGVFRRMIEEELEATADLGLEEVRRGTGTPSQVTPDPTQEHLLIKPLGFALAGRESVRKKAQPKATEKAPAVAAPEPAGPKRPLGLAKRPKPAATGDKPRTEPTPVLKAEPEPPPSVADEVEVDVDVDVDDDVAGIWPDITEEVAEVRFYLLQGLEDDARTALAGLKDKHGHHPDLAVLEAELNGGATPRRKKTKTASAKRPAKAESAERIAIGLAQSQPTPSMEVGRGNTVVSPAVPPEAAAGRSDEAQLSESSVTVARIAPKQVTVPTPAIEISVKLGEPERSTKAKPAAPARTGVTAPMAKPPTDTRDEKKKSARPVRPPPPPTTTPRSTPSVPPLRKPPMPEHVTTTKARGVVPPPPMPVVPPPVSSEPPPVTSEPRPVTSEDAMERSGEIATPRGDTVVSARPPEPPPPEMVAMPGGTKPPTNVPSEPAVQADAAAPELERVDRTVVAAAPSAPTRPRNTMVPTTAPDRPPPPAPFGGELPPGNTLVPGTTPPAGGFADVDDASSPVVRHVERTATPPMPMAEPSPEVARVEAEAASEADAKEPEPEPEPRNETVIARAPLPPAPYEGDAPTTLAPAQTIRLVMLGSRGQTVAERTIRPGDSLDVGRDPAEPWGDDEYLEERHARITPAAGGGVLVDDYDGAGAVFRQVAERTRIRSGDTLRVGQSLIRYEHADANGWGQLLAYPGGAEPASVHALGGAGATVGREAGDITFLDDTYVSGAHCRFLCEGASVYVEDLDSSNGTYVRVRQGEPVELGSLLLLGHTQFRVRPA